MTISGRDKDMQELSKKLETITNLTQEVHRWVKRLDKIRQDRPMINNIELGGAMIIPLSWINDEFKHETEMILDALEGICEKQIAAGYTKIHEMKATL